MKLNRASLLRQQCHVNGKRVEVSDGKTVPVTSQMVRILTEADAAALEKA
jgi:hypothetical protein